MDGLFGGQLVGIKGDGFVCFYDWDTGVLVRRIDEIPKNVTSKISMRLTVRSTGVKAGTWLRLRQKRRCMSFASIDRHISKQLVLEPFRMMAWRMPLKLLLILTRSMSFLVLN